jgi:ribosomal-protein-alanine N-acetyltransferase
MVQFTVRQYQPEDFKTLWRIDQACFPPDIAYTPAELRVFIQRSGAFTLVAEASPEAAPESPGPDLRLSILGFLVAVYRRQAGHLITIDVASEARRHRVGSALLDAAEGRMRTGNCEVVRLETAVDNRAALSFYKRHGYSITKVVPRYYSNGVDALVLEKKLLSPAPSDTLLQ